MSYKAVVILEVDFPEANTLEEAELTLEIWIDLVSKVMSNRVHWEDVQGVLPYEVED